MRDPHDPHLKDAFDDLVAGLDDTVDVAALRRRMARARRRRTATGISTFGLGVAGLVGAVVVIQRGPERAPAAASSPSSAPPATVPIPACPAVPPTSKPDRKTDDATATEKTADTAPGGPATIDGVAGIKGTGLVTAVAPGRVDVAVDVDARAPGSPAAVTLVVDGTTSWGSPAGVSTTPSELVAGQSIGFAGTPSPYGTYHALLIDTTAGRAAGVGAADAAASKGRVPEQPTTTGDTTARKSSATVVASDASTITVTLHDGPDAGPPRTLSLAGTTFTVAGVACRPTGPLAPGTVIGVVYTADASGATARAISLG